MKLNTDIRDIFRKREAVYPSKRRMNLYFRTDRTDVPATAALYILFGITVVFAVSKIFFYDPWNNARQLEEQILSLEEKAAVQMEQLQDYNAILKEYTRSVQTTEEQQQVDRLEILALIDEVIRPGADISQITIEGDRVLVTFSGLELREAADRISELEQSELVQKASVDSAVSTQGASGLAEIDLYFEVTAQKEADS